MNKNIQVGRVGKGAAYAVVLTPRDRELPHIIPYKVLPIGILCDICRRSCLAPEGKLRHGTSNIIRPTLASR
jgi:hypothetical protein